MKYYVDPTSSLEIVQNNSSGVSEITIQLGIKGPKIIIDNIANIDGVYSLSNRKKNPGMSYCEIDNKEPTLTDDWIAISSTTTNEITLNLKIKPN